MIFLRFGSKYPACGSGGWMGFSKGGNMKHPESPAKENSGCFKIETYRKEYESLVSPGFV